MADADPRPVDVNVRALWLLGLALAVFVAASASGLLLLFNPDPAWVFQRELKPAPVLQISPASEYEAIITAQRAELLDRGWVDREAGLVEIPVELAMRLVSEGHRATVELDASDCVGAACPAATPTAKTIP